MIRFDSVILTNFKSYNGREILENLSPNLNCITGENGTGKSNILDAISFALGVSNLKLIRAERLSDLIYKRKNFYSESASVILILNLETSKSINSSEVRGKRISLCRKISKDGRNRYFLNNKIVQPSRILNFLYLVNLNINNPHFIIRQGHIQKVIKMLPEEKLKLVENSIGTRLYDVKRGICEKILNNKQKIVEENKILIKFSIASNLIWVNMFANEIQKLYFNYRFASKFGAPIVNKNTANLRGMMVKKLSELIKKNKLRSLSEIFILFNIRMNFKLFYENELRYYQYEKILTNILRDQNILMVKNNFQKISGDIETLLISLINLGGFRNKKLRSAHILWYWCLNFLDYIHFFLLKLQSTTVKQKPFFPKRNFFQIQVKFSSKDTFHSWEKRNKQPILLWRLGISSVAINFLALIFSNYRIYLSLTTPLFINDTSENRVVSETSSFAKKCRKNWRIRIINLYFGFEIARPNKQLSIWSLRENFYGLRICFLHFTNNNFKELKQNSINPFFFSNYIGNKKTLNKIWIGDIFLFPSLKCLNQSKARYEKIFMQNRPIFQDCPASFNLPKKNDAIEKWKAEKNKRPGSFSFEINHKYSSEFPYKNEMKQFSATKKKYSDLLVSGNNTLHVFFLIVSSLYRVNWLNDLGRIVNNPILKIKDGCLGKNLGLFDILEYFSTYLIQSKFARFFPNLRLELFLKVMKKIKTRSFFFEKMKREPPMYFNIKKNFEKPTYSEKITEGLNEFKSVIIKKKTTPKFLVRSSLFRKIFISLISRIYSHSALKKKLRIFSQLLNIQNQQMYQIDKKYQFVKNRIIQRDNKISTYCFINSTNTWNRARKIFSENNKEDNEFSNYYESTNYLIKQFFLNYRKFIYLFKISSYFVEISYRKLVIEKDKLVINELLDNINYNRSRILDRTLGKIEENFQKVYNSLQSEIKVKILSLKDKYRKWKGIDFDMVVPGKKLNGISLLSGGQKSIVSISFIFSILMIKQAPVYIFDEIDAALDVVWGDKIGEVLSSEFKGSQFLIISLKNGILEKSKLIFKIHPSKERGVILRLEKN